MKRVLIVSPHFPPVNAPDMHRVRMSVPYFAESGWQPIVLTVRPEDQNLPLDVSLLQTIPSDLKVVAVKAFPLAAARLAGIGNTALRALGQLYRAGARIIRSERIDVVYFSTTQFVAMALGRIWKRQFGTPFVIDLQDPWFSTYYDDKPRAERPPKYALARAMHRRLERWTMREVDALITVSSAYTQTLRERYPWIHEGMCTTIPFGASGRDFDSVRVVAPTASHDLSARRTVKGVYVGRGGPDMSTALQIVFRALAMAGERSRFPEVRLSFCGTSYARDNRAQKTVEPLAAAQGVQHHVSETTTRLPYLAALGRLKTADFLLVIGSDDPQYSASKVYSYILARRPLLAIVHERSPLVDIIRRVRAGKVITFAHRGDVEAPASRLVKVWAELLDRLPFVPDTDWLSFAPYTAPALTKEQCRAFDSVMKPRVVSLPVPCTD